MNDLFLAGRRVWDPGLVKRIFFLPWEVELIQRIPVSEEYVEDLLIWLLTPTGIIVCGVSIECWRQMQDL